jgi:hypothetical protein
MEKQRISSDVGTGSVITIQESFRDKSIFMAGCLKTLSETHRMFKIKAPSLKTNLVFLTPEF